MLDASPDRRQTVLADRRTYPRVSVDTGEPKERRRRGRPPRVDGHPANQRAWTFLTKEEKNAAKRIATANGIELSELIRDAVNDYVESIGEKRIIATGNSRSGF